MWPARLARVGGGGGGGGGGGASLPCLTVAEISCPYPQSLSSFLSNTGDGTPVSQEQIILTPDAAVYSWLTSSLGRGEGVEVQQYNVTLSPLGGTHSQVVVTMEVEPDTFGTGFTWLTPGLTHSVSVVAVFRVPELVSEPLNFNFITPLQGQ